jgi:hypothetical protein
MKKSLKSSYQYRTSPNEHTCPTLHAHTFGHAIQPKTQKCYKIKNIIKFYQMNQLSTPTLAL